jgi:multidrug efflux system outer membrane protein
LQQPGSKKAKNQVKVQSTVGPRLFPLAGFRTSNIQNRTSDIERKEWGAGRAIFQSSIFHIQGSKFFLEVRCALLASGLVLLTGCNVGPNYQRPSPLGESLLPENFSQVPSNAFSAAEWKPAEPSAHLPRSSWWQMFQDSELDRLEMLAVAHNQELAAALARFSEAQAAFSVSRADLWPQVSANPSYIRQRTSFNEPSDGHAAGISPTYNTFTMPLQAAWEVDLWGRIRRQVESSKARLIASADDLEGARLAIQAEVATDFFTLRALDVEYDLLLRTAEAYQHSLDLTINRRKGGIATDLDVSQAETQLRTTEADLPSLRLQRAKLVHALSTLCGQSAAGFNLGSNTNSVRHLPTVPMLLPSELLERRPDIAAAEQRMASANAEIGVAEGAFYPRLQLNGLAGFQSVSASSWFDWPSRLWAFGPTIQLPLFTGGRNKAQLAMARASYSETVANYRQTVLSAFQEVEDQIAAQQLLQAQVQAEAAALAAAQRTLEVANNRYKAGLITYLEVAIAQSAALNLERSVVQLRGDKQVAIVGLIRALGGGWERNPEKLAKAVH